MMSFLTGEALGNAIKKVLAEPEARCAVAFWGAGSENLLTGGRARVVCNLRTGGTNPFALRKFRVAELRQCDDLHAKVYIGRDMAVVASANASANGLGLEEGEQAGWQEAGVSVTDLKPVADWFETIWAKSRKLTADDWLAAEIAWRARQKAKPTLRTFGEFNTDSDHLPLMAWAGNYVWEQLEERVIEQLGFSNEDTRRWIDEGAEIEGPGDEAVLKGQWVLTWNRGVGGKVSTRGTPWWLQLSDISIYDVYRHVGEEETRSLVLGINERSPVPFDPSEPRFVKALSEVVARPKYQQLRTDNYEGAWFAPRQELFIECWRDIKSLYLEQEPIL